MVFKRNKKFPVRRVIIMDDREKKPWSFQAHPRYVVKESRLVVGDYTFEGFEDIVAIEKKSGWKEIILDISGKYRPGFKRFLSKLSMFPIKCMVIEDDMANLYKACKYGRMDTNSLYWWYCQITMHYKIPIILTGNSLPVKKGIIINLFEEVEKQL